MFLSSQFLARTFSLRLSGGPVESVLPRRKARALEITGNNWIEREHLDMSGGKTINVFSP